MRDTCASETGWCAKERANVITVWFDARFTANGILCDNNNKIPF